MCADMSGGEDRFDIVIAGGGHAGLTLSNGVMSMRLEGTMGGVNYRLVPVSEDVFMFEPADAQGFSTGVLTVDRVNGRVSRFWLDTARTRNLAFSREI